MKLYVDFVSADEWLAITTSKESIRYNILILQQFNGRHTLVCGIGRYICLIVARNDNVNQMLFLDLRKNEASAQELIRLLKWQKTIKRKLVSLIELWNADYDSNFDLLELIQGEPPSSS